MIRLRDVEQAADEIKEHGRFVFEGTDKYRSYFSEYRSNLVKNAQKTEPDAADFDLPKSDETEQGSESTGS